MRYKIISQEVDNGRANTIPNLTVATFFRFDAACAVCTNLPFAAYVQDAFLGVTVYHN